MERGIGTDTETLHEGLPNIILIGSGAWISRGRFRRDQFMVSNTSQVKGRQLITVLKNKVDVSLFATFIGIILVLFTHV